MSTVTHKSSCIQNRLESTPTPFELLAQSAQQFPNHTALEFLPNDLVGEPHKVSYEQLLTDVNAFASALKATGIREDESVAILLPFAPQAVSALIAASTVATAFPVNLLLSPEAMRSQLTIARCRVVVTMGPHPALDVHARVIRAISQMQFMPLLIEVPLAGRSEDGLFWEDFTSSATQIQLVGSPDRIGALVHTGGTTGHPKLARLSLRNMASAALMASEGLGIQPAERLLTGLPLFHVGGAIDALLATLAVGGTVVFPTALGMRNPAVVQRIWEIVDRHRITLIGGVPTSLAAIVDSPVGLSNLRSMRAVMTGGSPLSSDLSQRLQGRIGKPICQLYGMTETSGIATAQLTSGQPVTHAAGLPVPNVEICFGEPGKEYRPGAKGEVLVRGPNLFRGYLTADGVIDDPQGDWFRSGDLGEVGVNGELRIVGRSKDVIIRSGHNIDPQVIEDVAHQHSSVAQAAAVAMPDDYAGEVPVLFVVTRPGSTLHPEELSNFLNPLIAEPPARPKRVFVLDELPLTPFAKVARFRLRQLAVEYRVKELLADMFGAVFVTCTDPVAKRVEVSRAERLSASEVNEIGDLLRPFDLQVGS